MDIYSIDSHKLLWHLDRVADWQKGKIISPIYVEISPVSYCNHNCIFCGIDFARNKAETLKKDILLKRLKEMGQLGTRSVMFAGEGEPLLHENLPEFIMTAKKSGMDVSLTTNGILGTKNIWQDILPNLTWIRFSVDAGSSQVYQKTHRVSADCFNKTIKAIESAVKLKWAKRLKTTIGIQFLVVNENRQDIAKAIKIFSDIGVDYFSIKPYSSHPQMKAKNKVIYCEEEIRKMEKIFNAYAGKMKIIFRKDSFAAYISGENKFCHCLALPFWGYISSNGDFYTCSIFIGDKRFRIGNIYKDDMNKIYFGRDRVKSICFGAKKLNISKECRVNCRMARVNEFLQKLEEIPEHLNFI